MGLWTALGVQDFDRNAALGENAGALAEFGDRRIPLAPLGDRDLQGIRQWPGRAAPARPQR
jgi:hypothetical protein